ncbi:MAG TPA: glycosyltransferase family 2 protein [Puia sp.]|nr:glycosyltransferase family 2 protein [Puia sp.]
MRISIITATFNSGATIRDTLECIRQQAYPDIEHIIVDGGSHDNTLDIVRQFPHVARVLSEKDNGIYDAMNKGIGMATGDVVGILNSDDVYTGSTVLSDIARVFADPAVMTAYADLQYVDAADLEKIRRRWISGPFKPGNFYFGWMPPHPTFFVRREVYERAGLFHPEMRSAADYEFMLRILLKLRLPAHYIPQVIVKMRTGGISNASLLNRLLANKEDRLAWKLNGLKPYFFTLYLKPLRKIHQFIFK